MLVRIDVKRSIFVIAIAAFGLSGCHSNLYATPRTVPAGKFTHTIAVAVPAYRAVPAPIYMVRVGVSDRIDIGLRGPGDLQLDIKANIVRSKYFDFAVNPIGGYYTHPFLTVNTIWAGGIPSIVGLNLSKQVTFMLQAGPMVATYDRVDGNHTRTHTTMIYPQMGGGFQFRVRDSITIQPEVSLSFLQADTPPWLCVGIGFGFGPQPQYD